MNSNAAMRAGTFQTGQNKNIRCVFATYINKERFLVIVMSGHDSQANN